MYRGEENVRRVEDALTELEYQIIDIKRDTHSFNRLVLQMDHHPTLTAAQRQRHVIK